MSIKINNLRDMVVNDLPPLNFIVDRLIIDKTLGILAGEKGSYKTYFSLNLFISISQGIKTVNRKLYLNYILQKGVRANIIRYNDDLRR